MTTHMHITLNGKPHHAPDGASVASLVEALVADASQIAIERGGEIVPRSRWRETPLAEGDVVELVRFVGGG